MSFTTIIDDNVNWQIENSADENADSKWIYDSLKLSNVGIKISDQHRIENKMLLIPQFDHLDILLFRVEVLYVLFISTYAFYVTS